MNLIQVIACALSVSLVLAQVPTFSSTSTQSSGLSPTVSAVATVGTYVYLPTPGWIISSDYITGTTALTFVATLLYSTAATSIGVSMTGGISTGNSITNTATCVPATAFSGKTNLNGLAPTAVSAANTPGACPVDFVSIFSAAPTTTSTTTNTNLVYATAANPKLVVGAPIQVVITPTNTDTKCHTISYTPIFGTVTTIGTLACTADSTSFLKFTTANTPTFGIYVNTEGKAAVCFQTTALAVTQPGCGTLSSSVGKAASSGVIASVLAAPLLVLSAILLN